MAADTLRDLKRAAKRLGVTWREVCQLKDELLEHERAQRHATDGVRRYAWECFTSAGCHSFWRCGWDHVRRRLENSGRDFTCLLCYDELVRDVAQEFAEWQGRTTEELFEFLFSDYEPWPPRRDFYERALGQIEAQLASTFDAGDPLPDYCREF